MISRGERGSSSGIAAISAPSATICSAVIRRPRGATRLTVCARAIFERPPNSVLDRNVLDRGYPPGEDFDVLRKTDHVRKPNRNLRACTLGVEMDVWRRAA
jgi:hypothetical protein